MNIFFKGRYLIILMGLFSMYTGLIYNECFSVSIHLFSSGWKANISDQQIMANKDIDLDPARDFTNQPYPFGLDPVWQVRFFF